MDFYSFPFLGYAAFLVTGHCSITIPLINGSSFDIYVKTNDEFDFFTIDSRANHSENTMTSQSLHDELCFRFTLCKRTHLLIEEAEAKLSQHYRHRQHSSSQLCPSPPNLFKLSGWVMDVFFPLFLPRRHDIWGEKSVCVSERCKGCPSGYWWTIIEGEKRGKQNICIYVPLIIQTSAH